MTEKIFVWHRDFKKLNKLILEQFKTYKFNPLSETYYYVAENLEWLSQVLVNGRISVSIELGQDQN